MDIPTLSMNMHQTDVINRVNVAIMKKTLDTVQENGDNLIKMMERSVNPSVGGNIDISV